MYDLVQLTAHTSITTVLTMVQDYGDKMAVQLLRVEMLTTMEPIDPSQVKNGTPTSRAALIMVSSILLILPSSKSFNKVHGA